SHGVRAVDQIGTYRDIDVTLGGPVIKDKLWFFGSSRFFTVNKPVANSFYIPAGRTYTDCRDAVVACQQAINDQSINSVLLRLTWQVSPRNKLSAYMDRLFKSRDHDVVPGDDPATAGGFWNSPIYETSTIKWTSTVSNRLLFEGGYSSNIERYNNLYEPGVRKPYGSPEWYAGALHRDSILGRRSNARTFEYGSYPDRHNAQAAVSYVRGGHSLKFGFQDSWGPYNQTAWANADLYQEYLNGPATVTLLATPARWKDRLNANIAMYGQDAWIYNPANMATVQASAAWTDLNGDGIAQGELGCVYRAPGCEINFANVPKNFGTVSLANPDPTLKRPHALGYNLGVSHELFPGVAVTAEWFHAVAKNILERNNILRPGSMTEPTSVSNPSYRPVTVFSPIDGHAITMYDPISPAVQQAVAYVDTNDPN